MINDQFRAWYLSFCTRHIDEKWHDKFPVKLLNQSDTIDILCRMNELLYFVAEKKTERTKKKSQTKIN